MRRMTRERRKGAAKLLDTLKGYEIFDDFTEQEIHYLIKASDRKVYEPFEVIFKQGTISYKLYLILSGSVILTRSAGGNEEFLALLRAGHCFGEVGIVNRSPRTATATAKGKTLLITIDHEVLETLGPNLSLKLYRNLASTLARKLQMADERIDALASQLSQLSGRPVRTPREEDWW